MKTKRSKSGRFHEGPNILDGPEGRPIPRRKMLEDRRLQLVIAFNALYMLAFLVVCIITGNREFQFYFAVMALIAVGVAFLHVRVVLTFPILWALSVWGLAHMAGGNIHLDEETKVLYNFWLIPGLLRYDHIVHAYGFGVATWVAWLSLRSQLAKPAPRLGVLIICVCVGMGLGAINEVVEFIATLIIPDTNVGDYANTGWDLVANFTGSLIAAVTIRLSAGK